MNSSVLEVICKIRARQRRLADQHPQMSMEARQQLGMALTVNEAAALVDHIRDTDYFRIGEFDLWNAGSGKIGITLRGDGEGGESSEADLAVVIGDFYRECF